MKNIKPLIISILIPLAIGTIGNLLGNSKMGFELINKPNFTPPAIIFPIVWIILYTLMGISSYIIYTKESKSKSLKIYALQLIFNMLWTFFFFNLKWYLFSFFWLIILIILVIIMIIKFYKTNKAAAYLQIPYLIWLIFASILNLSIYLLN